MALTRFFLLLVENLMTGTSNAQPSDVPGQQLDVGTLPNEALEAIYKQVVVELDTLSKTLPLIQGAINERIAAIEAIKKFQSIKPDDEVLVPLTLSSYVKGNVPDTSKVMVILGGGYTAEMSVPDAIEFENSRLQTRRAELSKVKNAMAIHNQTRAQIEDEVERRRVSSTAQKQ